MNACSTTLLVPLPAPGLTASFRPAALPALPTLPLSLPRPTRTRTRTTVAPQRRVAAAPVPTAFSQELCRRAVAEVNRSTHPGLQACFAALGLAGAGSVAAAAAGWWHLVADDGLRAAVEAFLR